MLTGPLMKQLWIRKRQRECGDGAVTVEYNPENYVAIMVHICDTYGLTHQQMMALRTKVEKTYHAQPVGYAAKSPAPVTLNGLAITYGLLIGFGGYEAALKASMDRVIRLGHDYDPYKDVPKADRKTMAGRVRKFLKGR